VGFANSIAPRTIQPRGGTAAAAIVTAADHAWERYQEHAALAFRGGDPVSSTRLWQQALAIAEKHFGRGDPRLAASLTNQAFVMRRRREDFQAKRLFEEALAVWADSWRWIQLMTPRQPAAFARAGSGGRLEVYDWRARACFTALAARGEAATASLERYGRLPEGGLDEWLKIKPRRMTDLRKLLAGVLLIAPKP
jgi:hypothetical protein